MSTPPLKVDDLNFESIKDNLKEFLKQQDQFLDVNFEGSGINAILDVLAYNTYYNSAYLNLSSSESFLSTAQKRNSVINAARALNYVPRSRTSARIYGLISAAIEQSPGVTTNIVTIPRYSKFSAQIAGVDYTFLTSQAYSLFDTGDGRNFTNLNVELTQGRFVSERYVYNPADSDQRFLMSNPNADTSTLVVRVQNSATDSTLRIFNKVDNTVELRSESVVYFIEEVEDGKYEIFFGDGIIGRSLDPGNIIFLEYLTSDGLDGNNIDEVNWIDSVDGIISANFVSNGPSFGGDERESIARIKFNAPKFYSAQNRTVTADDYLTLILRQPNVASAAVWGGEDNEPPQFGKVFIAIRPVNGIALTRQEKINIIDTVIKPKKVLTVQTEIVDPDYISILIDATVKYNPNLTSTNRNSILEIVTNVIKDFNNNEINQFSKYFRYSKLSRQIDQSERSILNTVLKVRLRKELQVQLGLATRYEIDFSNRINDITLGRPVDHPYAVGSQLVSNGFTFNGFQNCFLEENNGIIRIYRFSRTDIVGVSQNAGTINYETGKIVLRDFNPSAFDDGGVTLKLTVIPKDFDILPLRGQILNILEDQINVNLEDDTQISLVRR
jgi:hypothetical protein